MNIVLTGGGSGGHAVPAMAVAGKLLEAGHTLRYLGSDSGIERRLAEENRIPYVAISTGKLRRYWSLANFLDPLRVALGVVQAWRALRRLPRRDTVVLSFGGFVGFPVVLAAFLARRRAALHEQTSRAGLANRLSAPLVKKIFLSFESSRPFYPSRKSIVTGYPLRRDFFSPHAIKMEIDGRSYGAGGESLLLVTGGGNGSRLLNDWVARHRGAIPEGWVVLHQTGRNLFEEHRPHANERYHPVPVILNGMADLMRLARVVVARGGAGTVSEIGFLKRPSIIVPLAIAQRNEQYHNAREMASRSPMRILAESELSRADLWKEVDLALKMPMPVDVGEMNAGLAAEKIMAELVKIQR